MVDLGSHRVTDVTVKRSVNLRFITLPDIHTRRDMVVIDILDPLLRLSLIHRFLWTSDSLILESWRT